MKANWMIVAGLILVIIGQVISIERLEKENDSYKLRVELLRDQLSAYKDIK